MSRIPVQHALEMPVKATGATLAHCLSPSVQDSSARLSAPDRATLAGAPVSSSGGPLDTGIPIDGLLALVFHTGFGFLRFYVSAATLAVPHLVISSQYPMLSAMPFGRLDQTSCKLSE